MYFPVYLEDQVYFIDDFSERIFVSIYYIWIYTSSMSGEKNVHRKLATMNLQKFHELYY